MVDYVCAIIETNPLDGKCDQRVRLTVQPLEIIYHAVSKWIECRDKEDCRGIRKTVEGYVRLLKEDSEG